MVLVHYWYFAILNTNTIKKITTNGLIENFQQRANANDQQNMFLDFCCSGKLAQILPQFKETYKNIKGGLLIRIHLKNY